MNNDFTAIGQMVTESRKLLDSIKGGTIRTMKTQFDALKQTITANGAKVVSDVDSLGRNKLQQLDSELARVKQTIDINALSGEGRYVTEITVNGDKDTFYPVVFSMPIGSETEIQIFRAYNWNGKSASNPGDYDSNSVGGALVVLRGQSNPWGGDANYLRTLLNYQRYRQTVSNIGFRAFSLADKKDPLGVSNVYNQQGLGYVACRSSGFMLRGGKLKYQIVSNKKITFSLLNDGDVFGSDSSQNVKWVAKSMPLSSISSGDAQNNHPTTYIGYATPGVSV